MHMGKDYTFTLKFIEMIIFGILCYKHLRPRVHAAAAFYRDGTNLNTPPLLPSVVFHLSGVALAPGIELLLASPPPARLSTGSQTPQ